MLNTAEFCQSFSYYIHINACKIAYCSCSQSVFHIVVADYLKIVSAAELDKLSCDLMGQAFDLLAEGKDVEPMLAVQDAAGHTASYEFVDDGIEACIEGAHDKVGELVSAGGDPKADLATPVRYAIVYEGAIEDEDGAYEDAVLLEFGEEGYEAYSAYSLFKGRGEHEKFAWTDPAPAGELEPLI